MRRVLTTICALIIAALLPAAFLVSRGLPADTGRYVEKKYAGWNGVLQAWVCCEWSPGGNFISWLNECASEFEKNHEGVYIEFTPVDAAAMQAMYSGNIRRPELVFFSPGVIQSPVNLMPMTAPASLRDDLHLSECVLPVAMGGYIWVYNTSLAADAPARDADLQLTLLPDGGGRSFSAAAIALLSDDPASGEPRTELPDAGIDLGLPANAQPGGIAQDADALELFIDGELSHLTVTQKELARLNRFREDGRGADWLCAAAGKFAWADQLLLAGAVAQQGTAAAEREALAAEFALSLLTPDMQGALADIGAFSVTGETIHAGFSAYAELDALVNSRPLAAPDPFSEYSQSGGAAIVREYLRGEYSEEEALARMGWNLSLPIYPN